MNYFKYYMIVLKARINKHIQLKYIKINKKYNSVVIRNFGDLYLSYFFNEIWFNIDKYMAKDKKVLLRIVKRLSNNNKTIYLMEKVRVFTDDDIKYMYTISKNIYIYQMYMDKSKTLAKNQVLKCDITSYRIIIDKLDYFEKVCNKYLKNDLDKILFTIINLCDYVEYGKSASLSNSCLTNVFLLKYGVCIDFSIALYKCLERLNIESQVIKGIGNDQITKDVLIPFNHAWNQVKLDNKWYNIDITWFKTLNNPEFLLVNDESFYKDGKHKTMFEKNTCQDTISQDRVKKKIEDMRKYKNVFKQFDDGDKEIYLKEM